MPSLEEFEESYISIQTAAEILDVHTRTIRNLMKKGEFNGSYYTVAGKYFILRERIEKFKVSYKKRRAKKRKR